MTKVTKTSTKDVIYNAYQEALKELESVKSAKFDPNAVKAEKETKATIENAKAIVEMNILNEEIVAKYNDLEKAIEIKKNELKEYYGIEKEVDSILALIESKKAIAARWDKELTESIAEANKEIEDLRNTYASEKEEIKKSRKREEEEYAYNLKRTRQVENDKWEDEKAIRETILSSKEEVIASREEAVKNIEEEKEAMNTEMENLKATAKKEVETAFSEGQKAAEKAHAIEKNVIKRETQLEKTLLEKELEAAKATIERLTTENQSLASKLEIAQDRVQTIATDAVKAAQPRIVETSSK